jgi:hypothetical protein
MEFFWDGDKSDNLAGYDDGFIQRFVVLIQHRLIRDRG